MPGPGAFEIIGELIRQTGSELDAGKPGRWQPRLAEVPSRFVVNPRTQVGPGFGVGDELAELGARHLVGAADSFQLVVRDLGLLQGHREVGNFGGACLCGKAVPAALFYARDSLESALDQPHPLEFPNEIYDRRAQDGCVASVQQAIGKIGAAGEQAGRALQRSDKQEH